MSSADAGNGRDRDDSGGTLPPQWYRDPLWWSIALTFLLVFVTPLVPFLHDGIGETRWFLGSIVLVGLSLRWFLAPEAASSVLGLMKTTIGRLGLFLLAVIFLSALFHNQLLNFQIVAPFLSSLGWLLAGWILSDRKSSVTASLLLFSLTAIGTVILLILQVTTLIPVVSTDVFFGHKNFHGSFLILGSLAYVFLSSLSPKESELSPSDNLLKIVLLSSSFTVLIVIHLAGFALLGKTSAPLSLLLSFFCVVLAVEWFSPTHTRLHRKSLEAGRKSSLLMAVFLTTILIVYSASVFPNLSTSLPFLLGWRLDVWSDSFQMLLDHPFLGVGLGRFPAVFGSYETLDTASYHNFEAFTNAAHNDFLQVFTELGVVGGTLAIAIFVVAAHGFIRALKVSAQEGQRDEVPTEMHSSALLFLPILAIAFLSFVSFPLRVPMTALPFWFIFGAFLHQTQPINQERSSSKVTPIAFALAILILGIALPVYGIWSSFDRAQTLAAVKAGETVSPSEVSGSAEFLGKVAWHLHQNGHHFDAFAIAERATKQSPGRGFPWLIASYAAWEMGEEQVALGLANRASQRAQTARAALQALCIMLEPAGETSDRTGAIEAARRLIAADPTNAWGYVFLAERITDPTEKAVLAGRAIALRRRVYLHGAALRDYLSYQVIAFDVQAFNYQGVAFATPKTTVVDFAAIIAGDTKQLQPSFSKLSIGYDETAQQFYLLLPYETALQWTVSAKLTYDDPPVVMDIRRDQSHFIRAVEILAGAAHQMGETSLELQQRLWLERVGS